MATATHPVDEILPAPKLFTLGLQHVLVMYAGAIAVPLIIGRALQLSPEDVAFLISADLFVCGIVSILQSLGVTPWFGIRLPVMMGVTFASRRPDGVDGARQPRPGRRAADLRLDHRAPASSRILLAPLVSRMLRFFPPVVTGTIILVIGISLMRIGINWIFGIPFGPTAPKIVDPAHAAWLEPVTALGDAVPPRRRAWRSRRRVDNPAYAPVSNIILSLVVLGIVIVIARFAKGSSSNIAVLLGIIVGGVDRRGARDDALRQGRRGAWFAPITPFHFGTPIFDPILIVTMTLVMIVVMIESTGMFLALSDMTGEDRRSARSRRACGWTASARSSAASSTPSPTRRSRRTSAWSGSPASARAGSASPAA